MTFKPMLACEVPLDKITYPKLASPKLDGVRVMTGRGPVLTRSLKALPNAHVQQMLAHLPPLDGEVIVGSPTAPNVYNATVSGVMSRKGEPAFTFHVFDSVHEDDIVLGFSRRLERAGFATAEQPAHVKTLPHNWVHNRQELDQLYNTYLAAGYEGLMLRDPQGPYKFGRSSPKEQYLIKLKPYAQDEARVVQVLQAQHNANASFTNELGRTDRSTAKAGMVGLPRCGGFLCEMGGLPFVVAPGKFTHAELAEIWENRDRYEGKIITFAHFPYGVVTLPRFPRAVGWRNPLDQSN